ncbi:phosphoenolpyruvate--protein phosphotransferase [Schaalia sp. lx-100]|uniref:phosphoenolpyruvate--protein phosphotransferase n=1 Tax=Schaalia sp. lx-100 TaxID=2899081 RepID=UPI001E63EC73|nr:putative PEP-binding protein [Schaalia sp. lx-100]MCD4557581.1 phosphoenolpyruvate--protein phosphotransferase [Schaalia sp. lx-100]
MSTTINGTPVVQGIAYAPAVWVRRPELPELSDTILPESERSNEIEHFTQCARTVADNLFARAARAQGEAADVLIVTASLATDRAWVKDITARIQSGASAVHAVIASTNKFVAAFEAAGGLMAERTTDLKDVRDRILAHLQGEPEPGIPQRDIPYILLADDLTPADTAGLDPRACVAMVTELGGPTSHTSIIARQLGIPCIVAARQLSLITSESPVLVDAHAGTLTLGVDPAEAEALVQADAKRNQLIHQWQGPGRTRDGHAVQLLANVGDGAAARTAAQSSVAEGVGLLRTELAFLDAPFEPSIHEQVHIYSEVFEVFAGHKVVVRTLDAGSDKPVHYATLDNEPNPALGVRGVRTTGPHPEVLDHQIDALALAAQHNPQTDVWVMAPMVSTIPEAQWFTSLVRERAQAAGVSLRAGIMVEVPSVAVLVDQFMPLVDFVSIGTNDLTQYTMAADRLSADLAEYSDPWQPAPLALIARVARSGQEHHKPVGVCGEAASDPILACVLVGMGVTSLSMAAGAIAGVGAALGQVSLAQCRAAAEAVAGARDAGDARVRARAALGI